MMATGTTTTVLMITGMRDNACRETIVEAIESITGVKDVDVNLYRSRATIVHEPPCVAAELVRTVERAGYAAELARKEPGNGMKGG